MGNDKQTVNQTLSSYIEFLQNKWDSFLYASTVINPGKITVLNDPFFVLTEYSTIPACNHQVHKGKTNFLRPEGSRIYMCIVPDHNQSSSSDLVKDSAKDAVIWKIERAEYLRYLASLYLPIIGKYLIIQKGNLTCATCFRVLKNKEPIYKPECNHISHVACILECPKNNRSSPFYREDIPGESEFIQIELVSV